MDSIVERLSCIIRVVVAGFGFALSTQAFAVAGPYTGIYVFGDSLADSGNVYAATTVTPIDPFTAPTPLSPPYFYGRFSNGPNFADVLAGRLELAQNAIGLNPSLVPGPGVPFPYGTNYAWGGASTGPAVLPVGGLSVPSIYRSTLPAANELPSQLQIYGSYLQGAATGADPNALYVLWGGGNDLRDAVKYAKDHPATAFSDGEKVVSAAVDNLQGALLTLEALGAKHVLLPNAPNVGATPETRAWDTNPMFSLSSYATALTGNFNVRLQDMLNSTTFQGMSIVQFDTYALFNEVLRNPAPFGITNTTDPCLATGELSIFIGGDVCGSPNESLYWDNHHPSATMHALLGDRMYAAAVPEPQVYAMMLAGIVWLVLVASRRYVVIARLP
jgi:phospholipase/lecithinase/hemolysin